MKPVIFVLRILAYTIFALFFALGWKLVNADQTVCRQVGASIVCDTTQKPFPPSPPLDASVIGHIADSAQLSPETIRLLWIRQCVRESQAQGKTPAQIKARCFK